MVRPRTKPATADRVVLTAKISAQTERTLTKLSGLETQMTGIKTGVNKIVDLLVEHYGEKHLAQGRSITSGLETKTK